MKAEREGKPVRKFNDKTRGLALLFLEGAPAGESPSYAEGMRAAIERMQETLEELRALIEEREVESRVTETTEATRNARPKGQTKAPSRGGGRRA